MPLPVASRLDRLFARPGFAADGCRLMGEYWYRPNEILVHAEDAERLAGDLERWEATAAPEPEHCHKGARAPRQELPVARYVLPPRMDVAAVVRRLRQVSDGPEPRVGPNHLFGAMQHIAWFPGDLPVPAAAADVKIADAKPGGCTVAVIDTGVVPPARAAAFHALTAGRVAFGADDDDPLDVEPADGWLDDADGHGIFIAGIVLAQAPGATVRLDRALLGGWADEVELANAILRNADADVINLSLGGYCIDDVPPVALVEAIHSLRPETVVVAAAGNYFGRRRVLFPAALKRVVAVAAVDDRRAAGAGLPPRADFSNQGWWVDACAAGVEVLSSYVEFEEPDGTVFEGAARWSGTSFAAPRVAGRIAAEAMASGRPAADVAAGLLRAPGLWRPDLGTFVR